MRCQILDADEVETRYKKQYELGMKATRTIKLFIISYFIFISCLILLRRVALQKVDFPRGPPIKRYLQYNMEIKKH